MEIDKRAQLVHLRKYVANLGVLVIEHVLLVWWTVEPLCDGFNSCTRIGFKVVQNVFGTPSPSKLLASSCEAVMAETPLAASVHW